jgi:hypothetical protein
MEKDPHPIIREFLELDELKIDAEIINGPEDECRPTT